MSVYIYTKVLPSSLGLLRVRGNSERETTKQGLKLSFFERFLINNSLKKYIYIKHWVYNKKN